MFLLLLDIYLGVELWHHRLDLDLAGITKCYFDKELYQFTFSSALCKFCFISSLILSIITFIFTHSDGSIIIYHLGFILRFPKK